MCRSVHVHMHITYKYTYTNTCVYVFMCKTKIKQGIIYNVSIYTWMIIATTVAITTMTTKESDDKSKIRSICSYISDFWPSNINPFPLPQSSPPSLSSFLLNKSINIYADN